MYENGIMGKLTEDELKRLGLRIRRLRKTQYSSLQDIAKETGLSVSALSKVENGKLSLSFAKLISLSKGLGIDIRQLLDKGDGDSDGARRSITRKGLGQKISSVNNDYTTLFPEVLNKQFFPFLIQIKSHSIEEYGPLTRHSGEEMIYVLEGTVEFHSEHYQPEILEVGDSLFIDSSMEHGYLSTSKTDALVLSVTSENFLEKT